MPSRRGSILIWTVFLGLFIAVFFITFQSRLEHYFAQTKDEVSQMDAASALDEALESLRQSPQSSIVISDMKSLQGVDFNGVMYSFFLPVGTATEYILTNTGGQSNLNIMRISGMLKYIVTDAVSDTVTSSGVLSADNPIPITASSKQIIYIENIGANLSGGIQKGSTNLLPTKTRYVMLERHGDIQEEKGLYSIRYFYPGQAFSLSVATYNSHGMYLNAKPYEQ